MGFDGNGIRMMGLGARGLIVQELEGGGCMYIYFRRWIRVKFYNLG